MKIALPVLSALLLLQTFSLSSQTLEVNETMGAQRVDWMTWEEALQRVQEQPRKIVLDIYADWCDMCKHMESTTFQHPDLARYINQNFYPVKLNAQQREELQYRDKMYQFVKKGKVGYHELAAEFLRGRLTYPAVVFLDEDMELIQTFIGYKSPAQFEKIANYFGSDLYKRTPWSTFQRTFSPCVSEKP